MNEAASVHLPLHLQVRQRRGRASEESRGTKCGTPKPNIDAFIRRNKLNRCFACVQTLIDERVQMRLSDVHRSIVHGRKLLQLRAFASITAAVISRGVCSCITLNAARVVRHYYVNPAIHRRVNERTR
jgi:hypothetical protein